MIAVCGHARHRALGLRGGASGDGRCCTGVIQKHNLPGVKGGAAEGAAAVGPGDLHFDPLRTGVSRHKCPAWPDARLLVAAFPDDACCGVIESGRLHAYRYG